MKIRYNGVGSNQYKKRSKKDVGLRLILAVWLINFTLIFYWINRLTFTNVPQAQAQIDVVSSPASSEATGSAQPQLEVKTPVEVEPAHSEPSELVEIVAYITQVFEPEGKAVVVRAINCFYSESGLREDAFNQNTDGPKSQDHGVAQLNSFYHNLTEAEKTEYKANIDRAYKIYKGRGNNFSAWYGKLCN